MRRSRNREVDEARIDMTPMLDIVFIMLIFFIVTTSFVREFGVDVTRPDSEPRTLSSLDDVIAVRVGERSDVSVDGRPTDVARVRALVESGLAARPDAAVVIIASRLADAGVLVAVIDGARAAGAPRVSLAEMEAP